MSRERCCVGAQVTDLCRNVCDSYGDAQPSTAAGGDRGDNTARCQAQIWPAHWSGWGQCPGRIRPNGRCTAYGHRHPDPEPAADRQTDEGRFDCGCVHTEATVVRRCDRHQALADRAARPAVADAVMADPITEGVTEARLREAIMLGLRGVMLNIPSWYPKAADHLLALPEMRALLADADRGRRRSHHPWCSAPLGFDCSCDRTPHVDLPATGGEGV